MKPLLRAALLAAAFLSPVAATAAPQAATQMPAAKAAKGIWIDVRSPEEFKEGHLQSAVNIPFEQISQRILAVSPNKNAPVNLYCRSGRRADAALQTLKKMGYTNVTNHGGYQDLVRQGMH